MERLLRLLCDGEFHTGDQLGELLGVGRAAIWKQIQKLQDWGLGIQSVKGKGYRLAQPLELLDAQRIRDCMDEQAAGALKSLDIHFQTTSTNDVAMSMAASGGGSGCFCLAEQQTAGRGRRGRSWVSPLASNLYLSGVWEFYNGAAALEGLSLATAVAIADALHDVGVTGIRLKWPNDILLGNAKLAGILLEMTGDPSGRCQVVLGIGINHHMPQAAAAAIEQKWTALDLHHSGISRNALAGHVISRLLLMLLQFQDEGFEAFRARWQSLDGYSGQEVVIKTGAADIEGVADGVNETGGLRLITAAGVEIIKGGEVSLRARA